MREGMTYKRCTRCGARVPERKCPKCGVRDSFTWAYVVDIAAPGEPRRQRKQGGFATRGDAQTAMSNLQVQKAEGTYVDPSKLTVGDYLDQWLAGGCGGHVRPSTLTAYQTAVKVHIAPRIGSVPLQKLDRARIKALYQELRTSGYSKGKLETGLRGLSPKTVHNCHLALHTALAAALADGLIRANPADGAHKLDKSAAPEMQTWSAEELRRFLERTADDPAHPLWRLACQTGMRRGELLGLRWRDVDLDRARLSVRQQLVRAGVQTAFGPPKTQAGRRLIALDAGTLTELKAHKAAQTEERLLWGPAYQDGDLVFCRPDGHSHDVDVVSQRFDAAVVKTGVKRIRFHDLRHTHATLLLRAGVHLKVVQERLGHASISITADRYSHLAPDMQDEAAARIGAVVDGL